MELYEIGNIIHKEGGWLSVPDGKIDTLHFAYRRKSDQYSDMHICREHVKYGIDYVYREFYRPIESNLDFI